MTIIQFYIFTFNEVKTCLDAYRHHRCHNNFINMIIHAPTTNFKMALGGQPPNSTRFWMQISLGILIRFTNSRLCGDSSSATAWRKAYASFTKQSCRCIILIIIIHIVAKMSAMTNKHYLFTLWHMENGRCTRFRVIDKIIYSNKIDGKHSE